MTRVLLLYFFCLAVAAPAGARSPLALEPEQKVHSLDGHLFLLADSAGAWSLQDIRSRHFAPTTKAPPYLPPGPAAHWLRFALHNPAPREAVWLLEIDNPGIDRIEFFHSPGETSQAGRSLPFGERAVSARNPTFRIALEAEESRTFYLRVESGAGGHLPLLAWSPAAFARHERSSQIALGLFYGVIAVMALYNLFLFFGLRDRSYLYYVLHMASSGLSWAFQNGVAYEYLWPGGLPPDTRIPFWVIMVSNITGLRFAQSFLLTRTHAPWLHHLLGLFIGIYALLSLVPFLAGASLALRLSHLLAPPVLVLVFAAGVRCWLRGYRPARYYMLAGVALMAGLALYVLMQVGLLPATFITVYGGQIGWVFTSVLFSVGLADRIHVLRREKEAQEAAAREEKLRAEAMAAENARKSEELERARQIQRQFLPTRLPDLPLFDIAAYQHTATEVGGDYYDFFPQEDGVLYGALGDATGHGVSAGLMVACTKTGLIGSPMDDLRRTADSLNTVLRRIDLGRRLNMALLLYAATPRNGTGRVDVHLTGGGIPPAYLLRTSGQVEEILQEGWPFGVTTTPRYRTTAFELGPGDALILMSDGLPERLNPRGEPLGYERLQAALETLDGRHLDAEQVLAELLRLEADWAAGCAQEDDITLVVLRVTPSPPR